MSKKDPTGGILVEVIENTAGLYEGDLKHYARIVFNYSSNRYCGFHNFRHMSHVMVMCYLACLSYKAQLSKREMRDLLIAALFHDWNHPGTVGDDDLNITRARRGLDRYILEEDRPHRNGIFLIMDATEYPYKVGPEGLSLLELIIRDADMSQLFSVAWVQQVVMGFAQEWNMTPLAVLKIEETFVQNLVFHTAWAKQMFPPEVFEQKLEEIRGLIRIMDTPLNA